jgi:ketosteroid isomerase-like protein
VSTSSPLHLLRYYTAVDSGDIDDALRLLAPDVQFAILLPGTVRRGHDRQGLGDYLRGRGDVQREHVPLRSAVDGDLEFVYGAVIEDSVTTTGHFLASVRVDSEGLIATYQVAFDPELQLLPTPEGL